MKVTVYGPNFASAKESGLLHVHVTGCADTKKALYRGLEPPWSLEATSVEQIVKDAYPPEDFEYPEDLWEDYLTSVKVFPCVALPLKEDA